MLLKTSRTQLRLVTQADLNAMHELHLLPQTDRYNTLGIPANLAETQSILSACLSAHKEIEIANYTLAIEDTVHKDFMGLLGFKLGNKKYSCGEIWYKIHPTYWNKGIATEAVNAVIDYGFDTLHLHRIQAGCAVDNIGSIRVLEKVGMIREGHGRQVLPLTSGWSDTYEYALLDTDERK